MILGLLAIFFLFSSGVAFFSESPLVGVALLALAIGSAAAGLGLGGLLNARGCC